MSQFYNPQSTITRETNEVTHTVTAMQSTSMSIPCEEVCYFGVLQEVNQKVNRVLSCQSAITVHNDVEHELESLVYVLCVKELMGKE